VTGETAPLTEAEYNEGRAKWLDILTPKFPETTDVLDVVTPVKMVDKGEPALGQTIFGATMSDVRKKANPQSSDTYTVGATYPTRFSDRYK